ncbi:Methylcrotonyl-CoA carboxylase biotin-containing subunit [Labilithrix luteola]|uniref:Methylcrotonyl-CoA carboxylase biotin-containing subunit n=1 Tax=Labilithrix luteola TaxID=1391654 RepID=A0A0K1PW83_9BACT|nr:acetyl/propionyl/methylcrotonyl-CoA carboxylase subunit alpha [Labilithrix luteola]AKU97778.1 Methylcrotonyl-CoA carboxylase biotin-containing subunit [Labilithrix luteola]
MFRSLLIANRGEIACRIIRTARRLGITTIAVYSDADESARHVRLADRAVRLGPAAARESYLSMEKILAAAKSTGAEAIHPGYGFLSENGDFAEACEKAGIVFVGPSASSIRSMGSKSVAKSIMEKFDVPLTPGYHGDDQAPDHLKREADRIGYPVLIKASAGGGGKGMRRVDSSADFEAALASCKREAASSFGSDHVLVERYVERPRHIEVQVFGDNHGNYVYLFERDCSVQRRHQKVLEEAPAPGMTDKVRRAMGESAIRAAKAVNYSGAGTVEFIADQRGTFYFMEMNTRLQVEHPVTEKITGMDLVEWQLRVASGEPLPKKQEELTIHGHAIEARIYAENPAAGFLPSTGKLIHLAPPVESEFVRVDTGVEQGDSITPHYDPMIAKLIVWGEDRKDALARMGRALDSYEIAGVENNVTFLGRLVRTESFATANLDTSLIEREREALLPKDAAPSDTIWLAATVSELAKRQAAAKREAGLPWAPLDGWRLGPAASQLVALRREDDSRELFATVAGPSEFDVTVGATGAPTRVAFAMAGESEFRLTIGDRVVKATVVPDGARLHVFVEGAHWTLDVVDPLYVESSADADTGAMRAPMPGKVIAHVAKEGARVEKGAPLIVLEAMKMELTISAPKAGVLERFAYAVGEQVSEGAELVVFKEEEKAS